jgi:hypothetical protein
MGTKTKFCFALKNVEPVIFSRNNIVISNNINIYYLDWYSVDRLGTRPKRFSILNDLKLYAPLDTCELVRHNYVKASLSKPQAGDIT